MSTIAKLVVELAADPRGIKSGLSKAEGYVRAFSKTADQALASTGRGPTLAFDSMNASLADFARAGASASQIAQLTGTSMDRAKRAVKDYGEAAAQGVIETRGLRAAQEQMAIAGMRAGDVFKRVTDSTRAMTLAHAAAIRMNAGLTDATRANTLAHAQALRMNAAMSGKFVETRSVVLAHAEALRMNGASTGGVVKGMNSVRSAVTAMAASALQSAPGVAQLTAVLGSMAFGGPVIIGILAGVAAVTVAWRAWGEAGRKAKAEQDKLTDSLRAWYKTQKEGPAGELPKQIEAMTKKVKELRKEMDGLMEGKFFATTGMVGAGGSKLNAWTRILTAGNFTAMATQFRVELTKGTGVVATAIAEDSAAIVAATKESAKRIDDAFLEAQLKRLNAVRRLTTAAAKIVEQRLVDTPLGVDLAERLAKQLVVLQDQLEKVQRTDPFGEMAENLREVVSGLNAAILAIAGFRREQEILAAIEARGVPGPRLTPVGIGRASVAMEPSGSVLSVPDDIFDLPVPKLIRLRDTAAAAAISLGNLAASGLGAMLRSIAGQLNPFSQVIGAINQAAAPLVPVMTKLANIVEHTLGPVFAAFAPVIESLLPFFDALLRVLAPILEALAPLFQAFVPLLEALFPVIKGAAIIFTYVAQAAAFLAGILFNIAGGMAVAIGGLIAAIGTMISKIPFLGGVGRDIRDFGNWIKDLGKGAEATANGLFETADQMEEARAKIRDINIDPAQTAIDALGTAANAAAGALLNIPPGYKVALARFDATQAIAPVRPVRPPGGSGDGGGALGNVVGPTYRFEEGSIVINGSNKSASELFSEVLAEGQRRARSQTGSSRDWASVQV